MTRVRRSAIVPYSDDEMFGLVDDIEAYPRFLPWCHDAKVHRRSEKVVEASLELSKGGVRKWFTTRNERSRPEKLGLKLIDGPFRRLDGGWQFKPLGASGSEVALDISFEFSSMMVELLFGAYFEQSCNSLVDAFVERAAEIYGERG